MSKRNRTQRPTRPGAASHHPERRHSFMPRFLPALCLALLFVFPAPAAKPPDLPQTTQFECVPFVPQNLSMADRCEAMRTLSRCVLFGLNPLTPAVSTRSWLSFDE